MLTLLCASLLLTAVIVRNTYTSGVSLNQTARELENNLHKKESYINDLINDKANFEKLKTLQNAPQLSLNLIREYTTDHNIWFSTLRNNNVVFWSGIKVIPQYPGSIKEGYSFLKEPNGYYETIKKTEGDFSVIFCIPVKIDYQFQNQYLQNRFANDITTDENIEIADFTDKNVYEVHSSNNTYLFSVKLKQGEVNHTFFYYEITIWLLTLLCFCILINSICNYIAQKGYLLIALIVLAGFIVLSRWVNLFYNWPEFTYKLQMFNPEYYASNRIFRSLGDFCINVLFMSWFAVFLNIHRQKLIIKRAAPVLSYLILVAGMAVLTCIATFLLGLFEGLVINSSISFDVSNVLNLSFFSILGVLMLCFAFMIFNLINEVYLTIAMRLPVSDTGKILVILLSVIAATILASFYQPFTCFYLLMGVLIFARAYAFRYQGGKINAISFSFLILVCALIASIKLSYFESIKEKDIRKIFIQKLEVPDDINAEIAFKKIEKQIISDASIIQYFEDTLRNSSYLKTRLQKLYFNGYLSQYNFTVHEFSSQNQPISDKNYPLSTFKDQVLYSSLKVSDFFYRENESFGFQSYFAILPIKKDKEQLGTIVVQLKSKPLQTSASFPDLLIDGQITRQEEFKNYSYAFYNDNKLVTQSGPYVYNLINTDLQGEEKKYITKTTKGNGQDWFSYFTSYDHLIYKPTPRTLIVVSKEQNLLFNGITVITFFFVILLTFSIIILLIGWLWKRIKIMSIKNGRIGWKFKLNFDLILYKTRIQFSMIITVVATLILVGFITFFSISAQYQNQQDKTIREKITRIVSAFENGVYLKYIGHINEESQVGFNEFANTYATDLTLYDANGSELINTQPKIYESGLQARRMNAKAYVMLSKLQKSEFVNDEIIGKLKYKAAYMPVRTNTNETVAYLQLPYFANEADYKERIGALLNIMINVYALIFIAIGLIAIIIARQITAPLSFIQFNLSKTTYGKKNEPITWDRNDEIGALVKEYNKMIAALENSAQKLAQSERESAWREMAKQVAHEIKNPLTPLKLGLQLLDKSWKDKDPKFDQKFERFSKSFVEQIESLSNIASEFSAFAKMPDTRMEQLNIFEILTQAIIIFRQMDNVTINYQPAELPFIINADRDQLLRCFNNLLKNAIEASPADRTSIIEITHMVTSKNVLLTIKDNGNGIPENLREKIFEPNFTTKSSGTGLGLAFVKNSIENAGGKVWFETIRDEGTTFYISLPSVLS